MRKVERKRLYEKLTLEIGEILTELNDDQVNGWTDAEISKKTGIAQSRLTEFKNLKKYGRMLNPKFLNIFIFGGIFTVKDLLNRMELSEAERQYLIEVGFLEDTILLRIIRDAIKAEVDIKDVLATAIRNKKP